MDPHSLDVVRDPNPDNPHDFVRIIARFQWHPGSTPRMEPVVHAPLNHHSYYTLAEMVEMTAILKEVSTPAACSQCGGSRQVCNVCEKPGGTCRCPDSKLPTPMPCPSCSGETSCSSEER